MSWPAAHPTSARVVDLPWPDPRDSLRAKSEIISSQRSETFSSSQTE
jgi:hypothetical protein